MTFAQDQDPRLASADAGVRRIAILDIADAEDDDDLPVLTTALLADPAAEVRAEAARVLGGWGHAWAVDALAQALLDAEGAVRTSAAAASRSSRTPRRAIACCPGPRMPTPACAPQPCVA